MNIPKKISTGFSILAITACCLGIVVPAALAAPAAKAAPTPPPTNANAGQALEIAPPVITLSADPGTTIKTQISLRDISSSNLVVKGQVNDFIAAGEDGTPKILLDDSNVSNPFSIKGWVAPLPELLMIPKQIKNLPVTISVPANASPGGHYGVIRFTATPPELKGTGVSLSASLGSLVLINVSGDIKEDMSVQDFIVTHNGKAGTLFESAPVSFTEKLKNTGNTHEQPTGQVTVKDMFGKTIGAVNVNLPPRNVLPNSVRKFEQPLDSSVIGNKKLFGRYTAQLNVTYGVKKQTVSSSLSFWVIPYRLVGVVIAILIIGFFVLRFFIQRYNRSIINKASRRR